MEEQLEGARRAARTAGLALALCVAATGSARADVEPREGREELARRGCAACHGDLAQAGQRVGPDLAQAAWRLRPGFLVDYLTAPREHVPDTRMPDALAGLGPDERGAAARALAAFLRREASDAPASISAGDAAGDAARGAGLYHAVGCIACHAPRIPARAGEPVPAAPDDARDLAHVGAKYTPAGLRDFLARPLAHRPAGLMPDMRLTRGEAADLAAYLLAEAPRAPAAQPAVEAQVAATGQEWFEALRCGACHAVGERAARPRDVGPARTSPLGGCLADTPPAAAGGAPDHGLDAAERAQLRGAMADLERAPAATERVDGTLAALRCTACHARGGGGGVPAALDGFLATTEPDLGEPARVPPRLDGVGAKLQRGWIERVLLDGAAVRPYMSTRMPQYGADAVGHLAALLEEVDAAAPLEFRKLEGEAANEARDAGRKMLGTTGLGCVSCHAFNSQPAPGFQGLDLITTTDRLQPRWFRDFLVAPQALLPGVVMPESWPGGEAVYTSILDGDTERQIGALWHFLSLGRSAPDPPGIRAPDWKLDVVDAPRVYRGRSGVAGFRGIAVGFPGGTNFAFDANNGALAALWLGDFVSVNWNGQGAGNFSPRARAVALPRDLAFRRAARADEPWPLRPVMTEEAPVNPDPTYPRQHGYRFRGYHVDGAGVPTLRYDVDGAAVLDRLVPLPDGGRGLVRTLTFEAPAPTVLELRALAGALEEVGPGRFRAPGVELSVGAARATLRPLAEPDAPDDPAEPGAGEAPPRLELRLTLPLPAGTSTVELTYERLD